MQAHNEIMAVLCDKYLSSQNVSSKGREQRNWADKEASQEEWTLNWFQVTVYQRENGKGIQSRLYLLVPEGKVCSHKGAFVITQLEADN